MEQINILFSNQEKAKALGAAVNLAKYFSNIFDNINSTSDDSKNEIYWYAREKAVEIGKEMGISIAEVVRNINLEYVWDFEQSWEIGKDYFHLVSNPEHNNKIAVVALIKFFIKTHNPYCYLNHKSKYNF